MLALLSFLLFLDILWRYFFFCNFPILKKEKKKERSKINKKKKLFHIDYLSLALNAPAFHCPPSSVDLKFKVCEFFFNIIVLILFYLFTFS